MISSNSSYFLICSLLGIATVCTVCVPAVLFTYTRKLDIPIDEKWRDTPPFYIKLVRRFFDLISNNTAVGLVDNALSQKEKIRIEKSLGEAGYAYSILAGEFVLAKWASGVLGAVTVALLLQVYGLIWHNVAFGSILAGLICFIYPDLKIRQLIKDRKQKLDKQFPFFLDVLVLTMRAGLALSTALEHAVSITPKGPIKQEFNRALSDIRCGVSRVEALQRVAERVHLPSLSNFVAAVCQAEESGGSLTISLSEQARQRRRERFQKAEKLAGHAPVKLLVPLFLFIFPILFIIIGVPIALDLSSTGLLG